MEDTEKQDVAAQAAGEDVVLSAEAAGEVLKDLGKAILNLEAVLNRTKEGKKLLADGAAAQRAPLDALIEGSVNVLVQYATAHRAELTKGGEVKTAELPEGTFTWRNASSVDVDDDDRVVEHIQGQIAIEEAKGDKADPDKIALLKSFLRTPKVTLDREAMLKDEARGAAGGIPGVEIVKVEYLTVIPAETNPDTKTRDLLRRKAPPQVADDQS